MRIMPVDLHGEGDQWIMHCGLPGVDPTPSTSVWTGAR
jgi:hypothetical protein